MIRIRWAFYFEGDHKVSGGWNCLTPNPTDSPKRIPLLGLVNAVIESKDEKYQLRTLASCEASDFVEYQTIMLAPLRRIFFKGKMKLPGQFAGLRLVKKSGYTEVFANGQVKNVT
jgi:hypothetical protein